MLSVILYGRNDSHGYNLHKRGALSLNAIAEVMTEEADEIIFVDYNTPDDLPTFPEAIADTLTAQCKKKLRILRVRPSYHARFAGKTRLVALECQSRNIAIRRSNPANRWILSTNTDMIFHPRSADSLAGVVAQLEDGFYHLPRFEVPEGFWERLDRLQPRAAIDAMVEAGTRFHINEIVYGSYDNLYEGPGDFQLFLRQDLFDIHGFDERMILGWHADSNIARRMKLLRGEVRTAFDKVYGYHCGHTRQATSLHGGTRTENNSDVFVRDLDDPIARHQAETWGAPDEQIEEVRLDRPETFLPAMAAAVVSEGPQYTEATYNASSLGKVTYNAAHVLPHLCDTLFNLPAGQTIFYFGPDVELLDGVRRFLESAGRAPRFLLTNLGRCPHIEKLNQARWGASMRSLDDALSEAGMILVAYPAADMAPESDRISAEWWCQRVFTLLADMERARPMGQRRRIVVVNAIHTGISDLVNSNLSPTVTPFASRLRQGWIAQDAAPGAAVDPTAAIYARLGRMHVFNPQDQTLIERVVREIENPPPGWERLAPEIASICAAPSATAARFGVAPQARETWAERADAAMREQISRLVQAPDTLPPRPEIGNRLCSGADWDDASWARLAVSYFGADVLSLHERKRWVWERVSLAHQIGVTLPVPRPDREGNFKAPRILVLSDWPEFISAMLTHLGYEVRYATLSDFLAGKVSGDWHPALDLSSMLLPTPLTPFDPADPGEAFEASVITLPSLFEKSREDIDTILRSVHQRMKPESYFFASAAAQVNEIAYEGGFSFAEWKVLYERHGPLGARGFKPVHGFDDRVPLDTVVRFAFNDDSQETMPGLSYGFLRGFNTSAVLNARWPAELKPGPHGRIEWEGPLVDAYSVPLPYGATAIRAPTAAYLARKAAMDLAAEALRAYSACPPIKLGNLERNILPFVSVTAGLVKREPTGLTITREGGGRFTFGLDCGDATDLHISITDHLGAPPLAIGVVVQDVGAHPFEPHGGEYLVQRQPRLGRVSVAAQMATDSARLEKVIVRINQPEPVTESG